MMTSRERILTTLRGGIPDRVGTWEHFWGDTIRRWRQDGDLGPDQDPYRLFELDFGPLGGPDLSLRFPHEVVEETADSRIVRDIVLFGNIDPRRLSGTPEETRDEVLSKLTVAMEGGGYIFHSDHSVPPTVPFANYRLALDLVHEYGQYR